MGGGVNVYDMHAYSTAALLSISLVYMYMVGGWWLVGVVVGGGCE